MTQEIREKLISYMKQRISEIYQLPKEKHMEELKEAIRYCKRHNLYKPQEKETLRGEELIKTSLERMLIHKFTMENLQIMKEALQKRDS